MNQSPIPPAEKVEDYKSTAKPGPVTNYDWDAWFDSDGKTSILLRGTHYTTSDGSMRNTIHNNAKSRGLRVSVSSHRVDGEVIGLAVKVLGEVKTKS